jgi:hypothetical protein
MSAIDCSNDELRVIKEALLKARAQSETEGFETEKRVIDYIPITPDGNADAVIQDMYSRLLEKIQQAME